MILSDSFNSASGVIPIRMILNDLHHDGIQVFSPVPFSAGQPIAIALQQPQSFFIRGMIVSSHLQERDRHVISLESYSYRLGVAFKYQGELERNNVKIFCQEIKTKHLKAAY